MTDMGYKILVGTWLSLVEHRVRDAGVAGSNPVVPTILFLIFQQLIFLRPAKFLCQFFATLGVPVNSP